jgi:exodeoxyribonuclease VIII
MSYELMHDIETLSSKRNAVILSIGAVIIDINLARIVDEFYKTVAVNSQPNRHIDVSTVRWWFTQDKEVRADTFSGDVSLTNVLQAYANWISKHKIGGVWSNGADFDNVILRDAFEEVGIACPWHFRQSRCFRTLCSFIPRMEVPLSGKAHNALTDAQRQGYILYNTLPKLRGLPNADQHVSGEA